jgi:hypothetical protein
MKKGEDLFFSQKSQRHKRYFGNLIIPENKFPVSGVFIEMSCMRVREPGE